MANTPEINEDMFRVHILGPDDIIPVEDEITALRLANIHNTYFANLRLKHANDPHWPWLMAVVEKNGVAYDQASRNSTQNQTNEGK